MNEIIECEQLNESVYKFVVKAENVAKNCLPGQFVIVRSHEDSERIPLTISDYDRENNTVTIVVQIIGAGTYFMKSLKTGDSFYDFVGPLGNPSEFLLSPIEELKSKKIIFVAGGLGAAPVYPQAKWLHEQGIGCDIIVGAKTKDLLIMEDEMRSVCDNLFITTDDGSYKNKGMVTDVLNSLYEKGYKYDTCICIGPMIMMKFVCLLTKKLELQTIVSMNPIMVDGTGMCGACRLTVGDTVKFACVDGPEFDGHLIDFDEAMKRSAIYKTEQGRAYLKAKEGATHHGGCGNCGGED